jgi:hypothetical protein
MFRTTTLALRDGFVAAKKNLSRSSSWQSVGSSGERGEDDVVIEIGSSPRSSNLVTKKQKSILSQGTSNISDASSSDEAKKQRLFGRFRSTDRKVSRKQEDVDVSEVNNESTTDSATGKRPRFRRGSCMSIRKNCVIQ